MRWVLSPILGDGKPARQPWTDTTGPWRPVEIPGAWASWIPVGPDGPLSNWALIALADDAAALDPRLDVLSVGADEDVLTPQQRNLLSNALARHGIDDAWVVAGLTVGGAVDHLGQILEGPAWTRAGVRLG